MYISLQQGLDTPCGLPIPAQFAQFAKREDQMDLLAKFLPGNETLSIYPKFSLQFQLNIMLFTS